MEGWKDDFSVGIAVMDDQHKELIKMLGELKGAVESRKRVDVGFLLTRLEVYTLYHFASEEQLLARYDFPGQEMHALEHEEFKEQIAIIKEKHADSPEKEFEIAREILAAVQSWADHHLMIKDKAYAAWIKARQ